MILINPDPHVDGYVYFPTQAVTAFFPAGHDIKKALQDLNDAGFADERIHVFSGPKGKSQLDFEGKRHGPWVRFMRSLIDTFSDEAKTLERVEWYLNHDGRVVIAFTNGDLELKKGAVEILVSHGGIDVEYWGPWVREFYPVREPAAPELGGLRVALEFDLSRAEQEAENYRNRAEQAETHGLVGLKAKLERMATEEDLHAKELRQLLTGM